MPCIRTSAADRCVVLADVASGLEHILTGCSAPLHPSCAPLQLCAAISKAKGPDYGAQLVLPLLSPLLVFHSLPPQLFTDFLSTMRDILTRVEQWRMHGGGSAGSAARPAGQSPSGAASWDDMPSLASNGGASTAGDANGAVPALGLGHADAPGADAWAPLVSSPVGSGGQSRASSPGGSLQAHGVGAAASTQAPMGAARGGVGMRPGAAAQPSGLSSTSNSTQAHNAQVASGAGAAMSRMNGVARSASTAASADSLALASLQLGVARMGGGAAGMQPLPALPPPPTAGAATARNDPFADLFMAQPAPVLQGRLPERSSGAAPGVARLPGAVAPTGAGSSAPDKKDDFGGDWDEWDPFT
jgi:hypothetical protein